MESTTEDRLLDGRVRLLQPPEGYRAAIDPVLLAAAVRVADGASVLDLGCGVGAASLCVLRRVPGVRITGLELQAKLAALAEINARANGMADRLEVIEGDVSALPPALSGRRFDQVIANPPYLPARGFSSPPDQSKALANQEAGADLAVWIAAAYTCLRPKGWLTLIHRADRLDAICALLAPRFGAIGILPLWPRVGEAARRVIVRARRDARSPAALLPGLVLHGADGRFTPEAEAVLRGAGPLG
ncbi:MAG TPA: methyltransferase [Alphaproteobacteria bacterium]|nr:methyltransferase [Alphaproteobacteria bacterium]